MKTIIKDLGLLVTVWAITAFLIASCSKSAYAVDLSKSLSVTVSFRLILHSFRLYFAPYFYNSFCTNQNSNAVTIVQNKT